MKVDGYKVNGLLYQSPEYNQRGLEAQQAMIDRLNAGKARMLAAMSPEDRAIAATNDAWLPEPNVL